MNYSGPICPLYPEGEKIHQMSFSLIHCNWGYQPDDWVKKLNIMKLNAGVILSKISIDTNSCPIDPKKVRHELLIYATEINKTIDCAFNILKMHPNYDIELKVSPLENTSIRMLCKILNEFAYIMISKSITHSEHKNEKLLLLGFTIDKDSLINRFPIELINVIVITMFEVKFKEVLGTCGNIRV